MSAFPDRLDFKFRFVKNGRHAHIFAKKGHADASAMDLGGDSLGYDAIADTTTRDNRLVITLRPGTQLGEGITKGSAGDGLLIIETHKVKALDLERFIDRLASEKAVERHRAELTAQGKAGEFRTAQCPHCSAVCDVSSMDKTMYVYCRFCETVFRDRGEAVTPGDTYRICDECSMFDRVRGYTEFYFYFLLVIYGFSYKRRHLCDNCAGRLFWKALLINFIFVLGVPSAIWVKIKSMSGRDPNLGELASANKLAKKGRPQEADPIYMRCMERYPDHPGILYNQALGHMVAGDGGSASGYFDRSLDACCNYLPTISTLVALQNVANQEQLTE